MDDAIVVSPNAPESTVGPDSPAHPSHPLYGYAPHGPELRAALASFRAECPPLARTAENTFSRYADIPEVYRVVAPLLPQHGLDVQPVTRIVGDEWRIASVVVHVETGQARMVEVPLLYTHGPKQNPAHAFAGSTTYLRRYTTVLVLALVIEGDDDDGNTAGGSAPQRGKGRGRQSAPATGKGGERIIGDGERRALFARANEAKLDTNATKGPKSFKVWLTERDVASTKTMPRAKFDEVMAELKTMIELEGTP